MLSDPIAVTYDSVAKTLPRSSGYTPSVKRVFGSSFYKTADGEFVAKTTRSQLTDNSYKTEIILGRYDAVEASSNYVGLVFISNSMGENPGDFDKLRAAINTFVSVPVQNRLIAGEL